jgi:predicted nucleic-acid-binding protein
MLAVDTNVIVRFLTNDDPQQSPRARRLVGENDVWISMTVLLETEWVLRSTYRYTPTQIVESLRDFAGLPRVSLENPALVARALDWCVKGMDFADALHLGAADHCAGFVTFDTRFAKAAKKATGINVREP